MIAFASLLAAIGSALGSSGRIRQQLDPPPPPLQSAVASWYDQGGIGACGTDAQAGLGFASLFLRCGTRVRMCYRGCVIATMDDSGPYVASRSFDLNANLRAAIGFPDGVATIRYAVIR
jgi:hypothetical protein